MKEITDKMRLDFIEASGACVTYDGNDWAITFDRCIDPSDGHVLISSITYQGNFKPTLREAIDAAILEDATYN